MVVPFFDTIFSDFARNEKQLDKKLEKSSAFVYNNHKSGEKCLKVSFFETFDLKTARKEEKTMLYGEYQHNLDSKGRVTIPSKFREDLGNVFYVCKGLDRCLFVFSPESWQKALDSISALPETQSVKLKRFFFGGAAEVEPDKQGRILLPQSLREYAGLDKEATVVGTGTRAEIWNTESWMSYISAQSEDDISEALAGLIL